MDNKGSLRNIHIFGVLFFALAISDIVTFILGIMGAKGIADAESASAGLTISLIIVSALAVIEVLMILMKIYLGYKGVSCFESKKPGNRTMAFFMVLFVFTVLDFAVSVFMLVTGGNNYFAVISAVVTVILIFCFRRELKKLS